MPFDAAIYPRREQVLLGALDLLRTYGWCQDRTLSGTGGFCMAAAIREVGSLYRTGDFDALGIPWPAEFNDVPGRTFAEVEQWFLDRIAEPLAQPDIVFHQHIRPRTSW
jgi:hypothetical protein